MDVTIWGFDDFLTGEMIAECECGGTMTKVVVRPLPEVPATLDAAVCSRCGDVWLGEQR